jgi:hypothetical protein
MPTYKEFTEACKGADEFPELEAAVIRIVYQIANDYKIPVGNSVENQNERIKAFKKLSPETELSNEAEILFQEMLFLREKLLETQRP